MTTCFDFADFTVDRLPSGARTHRSGAFTWKAARDDSRIAKDDVPRPSAAYSKRSRQLANLRSEAAWISSSADDELSAPTQRAIESAEGFINSLFDACLNFRAAISHDGEINFFFGEGDDLFQILIGEDGTLSYYAKQNTGETSGSDVDLAQFPHVELLRFIDRKK